MEARHRAITYDELSRSLPELTIIDVRNRIELEKAGQIPGSHCIPVTEIKLACGLDPEAFRARYGFEKPASEDALVVCCKNGIRSKIACDLLEAKGYRQHRIYCGSFRDWEEKGGDIVKPGQPYQFDSEDDDDEYSKKHNVNGMKTPNGQQQFSYTNNENRSRIH